MRKNSVIEQKAKELFNDRCRGLVGQSSWIQASEVIKEHWRKRAREKLSIPLPPPKQGDEPSERRR